MLATVLSLLLLAASCLGAYAQTASVTPTFEAASVKPAPPPDGFGMHVSSNGGPGTSRPGRYTAENMDLAGLVMYAYNIKRFQISGPDWMRTERYNVSAIVPPHASKEQFRTMLQNLLAERFAFRVHWETREMPIYELAIAKGGPKLEETKPDEPQGSASAPVSPKRAAKSPDGFPNLPEGKGPVMMMMSTKNGPAISMRAYNETAEGIASTLSHQIDRPVRDATGLKGKYDFTLYWLIRSSSNAISAASPDPNGFQIPVDDSPGPTLSEAIQQQLGLKLQPKKGSVPILVVDAVEKKPTAD